MLNINKKLAWATLSFGNTFNMNGALIYFVMVTSIICKIYFGHFTLEMILIIMVLAILLSIISPGVPESGFFLFLIFLNVMKIPSNYIVLIIPIERLLDMLRTTLNILGDVIVTVLCNYKEEKSFSANSPKY